MLSAKTVFLLATDREAGQNAKGYKNNDSLAEMRLSGNAPSQMPRIPSFAGTDHLDIHAD